MSKTHQFGKQRVCQLIAVLDAPVSMPKSDGVTRVEKEAVGFLAHVSLVNLGKCKETRFSWLIKFEMHRESERGHETARYRSDLLPIVFDGVVPRDFGNFGRRSTGDPVNAGACTCVWACDWVCFSASISAARSSAIYKECIAAKTV